jgi:hypothetical protein
MLSSVLAVAGGWSPIINKYRRFRHPRLYLIPFLLPATQKLSFIFVLFFCGTGD